MQLVKRLAEMAFVGGMSAGKVSMDFLTLFARVR